MGCSSSKLHEMPAVALCRDRCDFLEEALRQSYAFADSQLAHSKSLETLGPALRLFFEQIVDSSTKGASASSAEKSVKLPSPIYSPSSSNSDSHIRFDSSSEDEDGDGGFECPNLISSNYHHSHSNLSPGTNAHQAYDDFPQRSGFHGLGSKTPPPPPPRSTAWDYLNFFDESSYERYQLKYPANELVEEKADHDLGTESVKLIEGDGENNTSKVNSEKNPSPDAKPVEKEEEEMIEKCDSKEPKSRKGEQTISEVIRELQVCFEKASGSGSDVLKMFDTGRFRYHGNNSVYQGSSKMMNIITMNSSLSTTEKVDSAEEYCSDDSENLSATLKKLCMWERKLYEEVKIEEKLRITQEKKSKQLKSLDQNAPKVDLIRTSIQTLSAKIRVAVQVIDRIAVIIYNLINEELWPQISELVQRLFEMWTSMLECYGRQSRAIVEAKCMNGITLKGKIDETQLEMAMQLKVELQTWCLCFCNWIEAQKGYVKALNNWLSRCLQYEPEGSQEEAPPLLLIINQWFEVMEKLEVKEVVESIHKLVTRINHLFEKHNAELKQKQIADKDAERRLKFLEKEDMRMLKMIQNRVKMMNLPPREESDTVHQTENENAASIKPCLEHVFAAMEKLASNSVQDYKELHTCIQKGETSKESSSNSPES